MLLLKTLKANLQLTPKVYYDKAEVVQAEGLELYKPMASP